jgi:hypothetical protein
MRESTVYVQFANDVQEGTLNTKTTPCSHGFKIYRPGQTDRLTELIYRIVHGNLNKHIKAFNHYKREGSNNNAFPYTNILITLKTILHPWWMQNEIVSYITKSRITQH